MYSGHEDEVIDTIELLDASGLLGRDDLREAFEEGDEDDEYAQEFASLLARHLGDVADMERLGAEARVRAARIAATWQGHVLDRPRSDTAWLTAPQVAARYGVTPQAIYKWIKAGRIQAEQTPGGSWRLAAGQFERGRTDPRRRARGQVADRFDVVAVGVQRVCGEVVGVVLRADSRGRRCRGRRCSRAA